jgi:hypothetical protein
MDLQERKVRAFDEQHLGATPDMPIEEVVALCQEAGIDMEPPLRRR